MGAAALGGPAGGPCPLRGAAGRRGAGKSLGPLRAYGAAPGFRGRARGRHAAAAGCRSDSRARQGRHGQDGAAALPVWRGCCSWGGPGGGGRAAHGSAGAVTGIGVFAGSGGLVRHPRLRRPGDEGGAAVHRDAPQRLRHQCDCGRTVQAPQARSPSRQRSAIGLAVADREDVLLSSGRELACARGRSARKKWQRARLCSGIHA